MAKEKVKQRSVARTADKEDKKEYFKMKDRNVIRIRMNAKERSLLETAMRAEGWEIVSGFIKYKLFGLNSERKVREMIKKKSTEELVILLRNTVLDLTDNFIYFRFRYDKDMRQLYREEGVDLKKWTGATNRWHSEIAKRTEEALTTIRLIARELGIKEYFDLPSSKMDINPDTASKEELDRLADQLRKERIMMGRIEDDQ